MKTTGRRAVRRIFESAIFFSVVYPALAQPGLAAETSGPPQGLTCESLTEPLGVDTARPRLSWKLTDTRRGAKQTAYEIQVASSAAKVADGKADVWDSGKIASGTSRNV